MRASLVAALLAFLVLVAAKAHRELVRVAVAALRLLNIALRIIKHVRNGVEHRMGRRSNKKANYSLFQKANKECERRTKS